MQENFSGRPRMEPREPCDRVVLHRMFEGFFPRVKVDLKVMSHFRGFCWHATYGKPGMKSQTKQVRMDHLYWCFWDTPSPEP